MSKVFIINGSSLWLTDVKRRKHIITGWVLNGAWQCRIDTKAQTVNVDGDRDGDAHPYTTLVEVKVPKAMDEKDYNEVITWAEAEAKRRADEVDRVGS